MNHLKCNRGKDGETERQLVEQQRVRHETCQEGEDASEHPSLAVLEVFDHGLLAFELGCTAVQLILGVISSATSALDTSYR